MFLEHVHVNILTYERNFLMWKRAEISKAHVLSYIIIHVLACWQYMSFHENFVHFCTLKTNLKTFLLYFLLPFLNGLLINALFY